MVRMAAGPVLALTIAAVAGGGRDAAAQATPPELTAPVNDFAGVIEPAVEAEIDRVIRMLHNASGDVIVVATVDTYQPWGDIREFATEMFENHGRGIGDRGRDNGLLIVLAVQDRQVWFEVGYDLESFVTDGFSGETSREVLVPFFRQGDYGGGLLAGVSRTALRIAEGRQVSLEDVAVQEPREQPRTGMSVGAWIVLAIVLFNLFGGMIGGRRRGRARRWSSHAGAFGAGYYAGGGWRGGGGLGGGGFGGGFGGFGGGRSGGGGGGASW